MCCVIFMLFVCSVSWLFLLGSVSTSASDWLERLVSKMTYNVLMGSLNHTHSLTHSLTPVSVLCRLPMSNTPVHTLTHSSTSTSHSPACQHSASTVHSSDYHNNVNRCCQNQQKVKVKVHTNSPGFPRPLSWFSSSVYKHTQHTDTISTAQDGKLEDDGQQ